MPTDMVLRVLALAIVISAGCREQQPERATGSVHVDAESAFEAFAAAAVTISAAYQTARDEPGSNAAIDVFLELARLGQEGKIDFAEAGAILAAINAARRDDGMVGIEDATAIVARAKALLDRSRPAAK